MNIYFWIFIATIFVSSFAQVLLKKSAMKTYSSRIFEYLNVYVILGYGLMFASMLMTIVAYKGVDYKEGPLIESLGNIVVLILGYLCFKEKITIQKMIGISLIIVGFIWFNI